MFNTNKMKLGVYEYICIITPLVLFTFSLDYLSDSQITDSETKIGIFQFIHHIIVTIILSTFALPFLSPKLSVITLSIIVSIIVQIGYRVNKDYCWWTRMVNVMINPDKPKRKWTGGDIESLMKRYVRGDSWTYSDMGPQNNNTLVILLNLIHLFVLIKKLV
jgi:hypothetical protein